MRKSHCSDVAGLSQEHLFPLTSFSKAKVLRILIILPNYGPLVNAISEAQVTLLSKTKLTSAERCARNRVFSARHARLTQPDIALGADTGLSTGETHHRLDEHCRASSSLPEEWGGMIKYFGFSTDDWNRTTMPRCLLRSWQWCSTGHCRTVEVNLSIELKEVVSECCLLMKEVHRAPTPALLIVFQNLHCHRSVARWVTTFIIQRWIIYYTELFMHDKSRWTKWTHCKHDWGL
jgi:hypothetical protein